MWPDCSGVNYLYWLNTNKDHEMTSPRVTTTAATLFRIPSDHAVSRVPRLQTLAARFVLEHALACSGGKNIRTLMQENPAIEDALEEELKQRVSPLLQHIITGEEKEAAEMLKKNPQLLPSLLSIQGTVEDYSGRTLTGTALQLAYGAQDVEMCDMLLDHFKQMKNGEEEAF